MRRPTGEERRRSKGRRGSCFRPRGGSPVMRKSGFQRAAREGPAPPERIAVFRLGFGKGRPDRGSPLPPWMATRPHIRPIRVAPSPAVSAKASGRWADAGVNCRLHPPPVRVGHRPSSFGESSEGPAEFPVPSDRREYGPASPPFLSYPHLPFSMRTRFRFSFPGIPGFMKKIENPNDSAPRRGNRRHAFFILSRHSAGMRRDVESKEQDRSTERGFETRMS